MKKVIVTIFLLIVICSLFELLYNHEVTMKYPATMPLLESMNDLESYTFDGNYIKYIADNTIVSEFIENSSFGTSNLKVVDKENRELSNDEIITTSSKVIVKTNDETKIYTVVVGGDVDQNGKADIKDILSVNKHRLGKIELKNEQFLAGDVDYNGEVNIKDLLKLNKYRLEKIDSLLPERIEIEQITLNTYNIQIEEGNNYKLEASIMPENATNKELEYISSDEEIAIVDKKGTITGLKEGNCTVLVQSENGVSAECEVNVTKQSIPIVPVESIEISNTNLNLDIEDTEKIEVTILPNNASNKTLIWSSSNPNVVIVDGEGNITAKDEGEAEITATTTDGSDLSVTIRIKVTVPVKEIILNTTEIEIDKGNTQTIEATVVPNNASNKTLEWISSNTEVATVDNSGKITGLTNGETTITVSATDGSNVKSKVNVKVEIPVENIILNKTGTVLDLSETKEEQLEATVTPEEATEKTVTWTSSDEKIATVDENGQVTGVANGEATITAKTVNGKTATCQVTVQTSPSSISLSQETVTLDFRERKTAQVTAIIEPSTSNINNQVIWSSSDNNIATVDNQGNITAVSPGNCTISATTYKGTITCDVINKFRGETLANGDKVYFIDIESADCILLYSQGKYAMIDVGVCRATDVVAYRSVKNQIGTDGPDEYGHYGGILGYLNDLGITHLEWILITHYHGDHYRSFYAVSKYLNQNGGGIRHIYMKKLKGWDDDSATDESKRMKRWAETCSEWFTENLNLSSNDVIQYVNTKNITELTLGNFNFNLYNLKDRMEEGFLSENINSIVAVATVKSTEESTVAQRRIAFMGDLTNSGNNSDDGTVRLNSKALEICYSIAEAIGRVDAYKVAHHGYNGNSNTEINTYYKPKYAIFTNTSQRLNNSEIFTRIAERCATQGTGGRVFFAGDGTVIMNINNKGYFSFKQLENDT